jgi:hypothetical protein
MYRSLTEVYSSHSYGRFVPPPYQPNVTLVLEGGAGGHMKHPFDVPGVNNGNDLIEIFEDAVKAIESERPAVKIDGANVSIKIARDLEGNILRDSNGNIQFGVDRGSKTKEDDIKGVTIDRLGSRFVSKDPTKKHGLIEAGSIILTIFNTALPSIEEDLKKLKFFEKDDQRFFNMEYVYGHTNVVGYDRNFLAIHGINSVNRETRKAGEVSYNKNVLEDIVRKIRPIAKDKGFDVYTSIPAELEEDGTPIDFSPALNSELTVAYTRDHAVTKRIGAWLKECTNPTGKNIVLANNKRISALGLENYNNVVNRVPLDSVIKDNNEVQVKDAICGAVFLRATLLMGQIIKNALQSEIGHVGGHEGIVVRNLEFKGKPVGFPVKFTGEFIVGKEAGKFATKEQDENTLPSIGPDTNNYINPSNKTNYAYGGYGFDTSNPGIADNRNPQS